MRSSLARLGAATFVLALSFIASLHTFSSAHAVNHEVYTVTTTAESGPGSLRQALADANASAGHDTITFALTGTIALVSPLPAIGDDITLQGPGAGELAISGGYLYRIFDISPTLAVTVTDLSLTQGCAPNGEAGGAIRSRGQLQLLRVSLYDNLSTYKGGAVAVDQGRVWIESSTVQSNTSAGGGIVFLYRSSAAATGMLFDSNVAGGNVQVTASRILANEGEHGAAFYFSSMRDAVVADSCIVNNCTTVGGATAVECASYNSYYLSAPKNWWGAADGPGGAGQGSRRCYRRTCGLRQPPHLAAGRLSVAAGCAPVSGYAA